MKRFLLCSAVLFISIYSIGQSITNYAFAPTAGAYTDIAGGTAVTTTISAADFLGDSKTSVPIPIGFAFYYMGVPYYEVVAVSDGFLSFNLAATTTLTNNLATAASTRRPLVAPLWDDLDGTAGGTGFASYITTGSAGSRIFTIEWKNWEWNYSAGTAVISFQVKLYESSGAVEFVYRQEAGAVTSGSASIGITAVATGSGNYISLNGTGASPTPSSTAETTTLSTKPATGQVYTFTPPASIPTAPTNLSFAAISGTGMTLNWNDSQDELSYAILRSSDGINYTYIASVAANTTTYAATGLNFGTLYYWKVVAVNEGHGAELSGSQSTSTPTLSGTKYVGTGTYSMDYATLTDAVLAINTYGLAGNITLILNTTYTSSDAVFPIDGPIAAAIGSYTVTIYPSVTGLSITSASATGTINLNGSKNVIFDGRVGGTGSTRDLVIANTNVAGYVVQFINDASSNTLKYCQLKGVNSSTTGGVIVFRTTTGTTGNDNNTIDNCDIRDGATTPTNGIYSAGSSTNASTYNSGNTVSNCNIFNYYNSTSTANAGVGINLSSYNTDWIISGNSFYQTASRTLFGAAATHNAILVSSSTVNGTSISGNYIGGSAPLCAGPAYTLTAGTTLIFNGLKITAGSTTPTSIQGNTIANISVTTTSLSTAQSLISLITGSFNCGDVTGNTLGSQSSTGSISISISGTAAIFSAILAGTGTPGVINISNNTVGGISVVNTGSPATGTSVRGIGVQGNATSYTISGNTIGSATTANSFSSTTNSSLLGIFSASASATSLIQNNIVANLTNSGPGVSSQVIGILCQGSSGGVFTTTGNTVRNLTVTAANPGTGSGASVIGISHTAATTAGQSVAQNTVYALSNTNVTAAVSVTGIHYAGPATGTNLVARNFVHSLYTASSSASADLRGINFAGGLASVQNNMVRLGIDAAGNPMTLGINITGIYDVASAAGSGVYFNSVYIGGTGVSIAGTPGSSYAFRSDQTINERTYENNIFYNARSNTSTGGGKHYGIRVAGTGISPTGLTSNYNDLYATGTEGFLGYYDLVDYSTLSAWSAATGQDGGSISAYPQFITPAGNSATVNLHISANPTSIESAGFDIAAITDDYDGELRSGLTPTDIGADAGNFTQLDISPPAINYTLLAPTTSMTNRNFTGVDITDVSGVNTTAGTKPRVYFKRSTDDNAFIDNTNATNGWKWAEANGSSSPFDFTIDYALLNGGTGVGPGTTVQYFVVAQDLADIPNVGINSGSFPVAPTSVALTAAAFPVGGSINSYPIQITFSGNYNVGSAETLYKTLTADDANGFFKAVNIGVVTGNFTVTITSDITEPGTIALNQWAEEGTGGYTMTIVPDASKTTEKLISGIAVVDGTPMINFNGADRVTIDGRSGGSGMFLRFRNTNATPANTGPALQFTNGATGMVLRDCYIETNATATTAGNVVIGGTGTNDVSIMHCHLKDFTADLPYNAVYSASATNTVTVTGCDIYNWSNYGLYLSNVADGAIVTNNNFYQGASRTTALVPIYMGAGNGHEISGNNIGGSAADRSGAAMTTSGAFTGISLSAGSIAITSIQGNHISNIVSTSTTASRMIYVPSGTVDIGTVTGNVIGGAANGYDIINLSSANEAIYIAGSGNMNIENNTIGNITYSNALTTRTCGIYATSTGKVNIKNNIIRDLSSNSTGTTTSTSIPVGIYLSTSGNGHNVEGNQIYNISQTNTGTSAYTATGIYIASVASTPAITTIQRNWIYNITAAGLGTGTSSPLVYGIYASSGSATYANNMIALGSGVGNQVRVTGIVVVSSSGANEWYYNSVSITGTTAAGTNNSYAFNRSGTNTVTIKNNIFSNMRTGGTGFHVAIANTNTAATNWAPGASDYNVLLNADGTKLALWRGTVVGNTRDLAGWQASQTAGIPGSEGDLNAITGANPGFASTTDLHISQSYSFVSNNGTPLNGIIDDDFDKEARSATTPDRGADEYTYVQPTILDPTGVSATAISTTQIDLAFTSFQDADVVIVWNMTGTFTAPSGIPPAPGIAFAGGTMLYQGGISPQSHTSLLSGHYYYKLFSYDASVEFYSTGVQVDATTLPVANPAPFTATAVAKDQIDLSWVQNVTGDDVMIATNSTATFGTPVNGTTYTDQPGSNAIAGGGTVIYNGPLAAFSHTGLVSLTTYYYKAYSVDAIKNYSAGATANAITMCDYYTITGTSPGTRCGTGTVELGATSQGGTINWYAAATGGFPVATGPTYTTPIISATTNFYATTVLPGIDGYVGALNTAISTSLSSQTTTTSGINFDVLAPTVTVVSMDIYPTAAVGSSFTITIKQGTPTIATYSGTTTVSGTTTNPIAQTVPVNFVLPAGTGYRITCSTNPGIIRNSGGDAFPYTIPNVISLTSSTLSGYFYNFYNWHVTTNCESPRTAVQAIVTPPPATALTATPPTICAGESVVLEVTSGNTGYEYTWAPATTPSTGSVVTATPLTSTVYSVTATDNSGGANNGCVDVNTLNFVVKPVPSLVTATASANLVCTGSPFDLFSSSTSNSYVPTTYISPTEGGGFELGPAFTDNGWTVVNSAINYWVLGNLAPAYQGSRGAHISLNGTAYDYTIATYSTSHFYRDVDVPSGVQDITLSFYWKGSGELLWDRLLIYTAPNTVTPVADVPVSNSTVLTGATLVWTQPGYAQADYTLATVTLPGSLAGTTVRLIFTWQSDAADGVNPPAAVDNISLTAATSPPSSYSWTSIPAGFTSSEQNPAGITETQTTEYIVAAQNSFGCTTSASTTVAVGSGASFTTQPVTDITICADQSTTMSVVAVGPGLTYQWRKNGSPVTGNPSATNDTLSLTNVVVGDGGSYDVVVTPSCGSPNTSNACLLTVKPVPLATAFSNSPVCNGTTLNLYGLTDHPESVFSWTGPNGFSSTVQDPVIPSITEAVAGTYTFTALLNGCISQNSTTSVTVSPTPSIISVEATPPNVCYNQNTQLQVYVTRIPTPAPADAYTFIANSGTYTELSGGTNVSAIQADDVISAALPIGFTFNYCGVDYTTAYASSNGYLSFNSLASTTSATNQRVNNLTAPATTLIPMAAPLWDDLDGREAGGTSYASYLTTGPAGNRVFTFEWRNWEWTFTASAAVISFQAKLYESDGHIEFVYRNDAGTPTTSATASIGLAGPTQGAFLSLDGTGTSPGASSAVETNNLNTEPATGQVYSFEPPSVPFNYQWTPVENLNNPAIANPYASNITVTTNYNVTVTYGSCSTTGNVEVSVGLPLSAIAGTNPALPACEGTPVTVSATPVGGGGPYNYIWASSGTTVSTLQSFDVTPPVGTTTYDVTITDNCGASAYASVSVTVKPVPTVSASSNSPACTGTTLYLTGTINMGDAFSWTGPSGYTSSLQNPEIPSVTLLASGTYMFTSTLNGCTSPVATTSVGVYFTPLPLTITPTAPLVPFGAVQQLNVTGGLLGGTIISELFNNPATLLTAGAVTGTFTEAQNTIYYAEGASSHLFKATSNSGEVYYAMTNAINLAAVPNPKLQFSHICATEAGDYGYVQYSVNGGSTWTSFPTSSYTGTAVLKNSVVSFDETSYTDWNAQFTSSTSTPGAGPATSLWKTEIITIPPAAISAQFKIRFRITTDASTLYYGWLLDDMTISGSAGSSQFTWSPEFELYTDPGATVPYVPGTYTTTVFTKPSADITYTATAISPDGCTISQTVFVTSLCPPTAAPLAEDFELETFQPYCWGNTAVSGSYLWARSTDASGYGSGTGSAFADFYFQSAGTYELRTRPFNITGLIGPKLHFDWAYAAFDEYATIEAMNVYTSVDQGTTWNLLLAMPGGKYGLLNPFNILDEQPFIPTAGQWSSQNLALPAGTNMVKFQAIAAAGNNLFLDNVMVFGAPTVTTDAATGVTSSGATLNGTVDANFASTTVTFEYGETDAYGSTANAIPGTVTGHAGTLVSYDLAGLAENTTYHYRAVGVNAAGTAYGSDRTFTTEPGIPVNNTITGTVGSGIITCYAAQEIIYVAGPPLNPTTTFTLTGSGNVTFEAGLAIYFYPGTHASPGTNGRLFAHIIPGGPWCPPTKITQVTTIPEEQLPGLENANFTLYPNPTNGNFILVQKGAKQYSDVRVEVYSMRGERLFSAQMIGEKQHEFATSSLPAGLYFVKVIAENYTETIKLIKTR